MLYTNLYRHKCTKQIVSCMYVCVYVSRRHDHQVKGRRHHALCNAMPRDLMICIDSRYGDAWRWHHNKSMYYTVLIDCFIFF